MLMVSGIETMKTCQQKHLDSKASRWVTHTRPQNILQPRCRQPHRQKIERRYTVARFALSSTVLPLVTDAMLFAETARFAFSSWRPGNSYSPALTGKTKDGVPLVALRSRSQSVILKRGQNIKYRPYAFTEHGILMLSSVLNSQRAIKANIEIMRTFVRLRHMLSSHAELCRKLDELEK